mmetsp:Transcript_18581/g.27785  ORF Transcript_18581/g.27785 Transcript_18581/m.27785 type:complete len:88 (+) Transcript_18581:1258-1521(+)
MCCISKLGNSGNSMPAVRSGNASPVESVIFGPTKRIASNSPAPESKVGKTTRSPSAKRKSLVVTVSRSTVVGCLSRSTSCHSTLKRS